MNEFLGKKVLWVTPKTTNLIHHTIRCTIVKELSPSGQYVLMGDGQWYPTNNIQILEVLDEVKQIHNVELNELV